MGDFPDRYDGSLLANFGANAADSQGVTLTSGAANVKGSWVQLVASTPFPVTGLHVYRVAASLTGTAYHDDLMDIGVGATQVVKIADIPYVGTDTVNFPAHHYYFPIAIKQGEEISARFASSDATETMDIVVIAESRGLKSSGGYSLSRTYGAVSGDSGGTQVDPGTTANTKGGSVPITTSTEFDIKALCVFQHAAGANGGLTDANFLMDVEVGAAASEVAIINNIGFLADGSPDAMAPIFLGCFAVNIPAGSRVSANAQCTITGVDRLIDVILIGFG